MSDIIVRMPPSPTGHLHLGTARTGLFNYLFAKKNQGKIIFRWEDTDRERSKSEFETEILEGLKWLGMDFAVESEALVRQTENTSKHEAALAKLWDAGKIFPCFCTTEEIDQMREEAQKNKQNFVFWSPFRELEKSEAREKMQSEKFVWRLRCPKNQEIKFTDLVKEEIVVNSNTIGDFAVARADGSVLYMLANVVDDLDCGTSHVIRGDDHISNTPKQILILEALGERPFVYAHIPLVLDQKRRKLSKRNVEPGVCILISDFQKAGFLAEGVVNGLAFLGWNPKSTEEIFDLEKLSEIFDLAHVNKAGAQYDFEKMEWFNQMWMKSLPIEDICERFLVWQKTYGKNLNYDAYKLQKSIDLIREKSKTFADLESDIDYLCFDVSDPEAEKFANPKMKVDTDLAKKVLGEIKNLLENIDEADFTSVNIKDKSVEKIGEMGLKNGQFLWPFRYALSVRDKSCGPFDMAEILGKTESLKRIDQGLSALC